MTVKVIMDKSKVVKGILEVRKRVNFFFFYLLSINLDTLYFFKEESIFIGGEKDKLISLLKW